MIVFCHHHSPCPFVLFPLFLSLSLSLFLSPSAISSQSTANIYLSPPSISLIHPPNSQPPSLSTSELNAFLSLHLAISHYESLPETLHPHTHKAQTVIGNIHASIPDQLPSLELDPKLVLVIYGSDGNNLIPEQFLERAQHLSLPNPPDSLSFDGLISTYIGRIVHAHKIPIHSIHGLLNFLKPYHDGLGGGVLDNLAEWARDWEESVAEWLAWGKDTFKAAQDDGLNGKVVPKDEYTRWLNLYGPLDSSAQQLIEDLKALDAYTEQLSSASPSPMAFLRLSGLQQVQRQHGEHSTQYRAASGVLKRLLAGALSAAPARRTLLLAVPTQPTHTRLGKRTSFSVLAPFQTSPHSFVRRDLIERRRAVFGGAEPIITSSRKCFESAAECEKNTDSCNGHGSCVQGQKTSGGKCFVCQCSKAKDSHGKTVSWSGETCQKQDISSGFVLVAGSAIALVIVFGLAIGLLVSIGSEGLPQQLASVSGSSKKLD